MHITRSLVFACTASVLVACSSVDDQRGGSGVSSASPQVPTIGSGAVVVMLERQVSEDAQATVSTRAVLRLSGAITRVIDLGRIDGQLAVVHPTAAVALRRGDGQVLAALTSWWAGAGDEIVLVRTPSGTLRVTRQSGDESGACTKPMLVTELPLRAGTTVTLRGFSDPMANASSIAFCNGQVKSASGAGAPALQQ